MISIQRTNSDNPNFRQLVDLLNADLWQRYPDIQHEYDKHNAIEHNNNVVVAYAAGIPVGIGCFKKFDSHSVELKRMFVILENRKQGIAGRIVNELEVWAKEQGFTRILLETGNRQHEAVNLYNKLGYSVIVNFPPYEAMETSICMERHL